MALRHASSSTAPSAPLRTTEFEILKASHKFLRDDEEQQVLKDQSWDDQVAAKYYATLYREFAVCDLKHYKSGNLSLRWRTESEVLSAAGEESCGNTRCVHHAPPRAGKTFEAPALSTLELPFAYDEHGVRKSALVKVVLCARCVKKLMWKREKERDGGAGVSNEEVSKGARRRNSRSRSPRRRTGSREKEYKSKSRRRSLSPSSKID